MRVLDTRIIQEETQDLIALRDRLVLEVRTAAGKKGAGAGPKGKGKQGTSTPAQPQEPLEPADYPAAFNLALSTLSALPSSAISSTAHQSTTVLCFDALTLLLTRAQSLAPTNPSLVAQFDASFLLSLTTTIYTAWDAGPSALLQKCKSALVALVSLSSTLGSTVVLDHLRETILVDPWNAKRSINTFDVISPQYAVDDLAMFGVEKEGQEEGVGCRVLRRFTRGMAESDETATLAGNVAVRWAEKVWAEGKEGDMFWIQPVVEACREGEKGRHNVCLYLLPALLERRKSTFVDLMKQGGFLDGGLTGENELEAALAILKVGNSLGLIELEATEAASSIKLTLPTTLLSTCLYHSSPSLRCSALSLLVLSASTALAFPASTFPLLRIFYTYSSGDEEGEFRMTSIALSGKLLLRLRDSAWKAQRRVDKFASTPISELDPTTLAAQAYVTDVRSFLEWWSTDLLSSLNPAKPFRIRINSLRLLELLYQAKLDPLFGSSPLVVPSSTTALPIAQFQAKHRKISTDGAAEAPTPWPFPLALVTPQSTFILLRLLLSTYTALRALGISLLEQFPSPLPGYEGVEGSEKAKQELLAPALRMVRSGREAEASAGAGVVGLVWRKWVLEGEGGSWDLGEVGGWKDAVKNVDGGAEGPVGFSFISSLLSLASHQLDLHSADLARAASTSPMHGTLLSLRHLFSSIPLASFATLSTPAERRALFVRALKIVERVWEVTAPVLAASAPEGKAETTDTEEARALRVESGAAAAPEDGEGMMVADGSGGPMHKIILSATWRAMKEAGELLETLLRLPSELGAAEFQSIWPLEDVKHIGSLFATWLARIRHRGAFMALHPCYGRACSALLLCKDWPEVQKLPVEWLGVHIESIISQKVSITRRSAGIPYCILAILTAILPHNRPAFETAFVRLFEIAESKSADILDESRVHAMNTLRTTFLDAKCSNAVGPYVERGFLISIAMFWSSNWICRNVAMMTYAALVTRSFSARRTNLDRDHYSLQKRLTSADFFGRYPALHGVLTSELEFSSREHLNDLPTSDLHSSLFSVLMLLSLLQTPNRVGEATESFADPFIPIVQACAKSRVWKIRDAAGDALTGLVSPAEVGKVCLRTLEAVETCGENELHGRLVQVLRLLQASSALSADDQLTLHAVVDRLTPLLLARTHSFSVRTTFLSIALTVHTLHSYRSPLLLHHVHSELSLAFSPDGWPIELAHLPSAENFVAAAFALALAYEPTGVELIEAGLQARFLEVQRLALAHLDSREGDLDVRAALLRSAGDESIASECRIGAIGLLSRMEWSGKEQGLAQTIEKLREQCSGTVIVPLREALLPLIARMVNAVGDESSVSQALDLINPASGVDESIESRESAALALREIRVPTTVKTDRFARLLLRLLQDDDPTVREYASDIVSRDWTRGVSVTERRSVELILAEVGPTKLELVKEEFAADLALLSNPSSLLFAIEKPNIFKDDLLELDLLPSTDSSSSVSQALRDLEQALAQNPRGEGPFGLLGNELVCKWAARLTRAVESEDELVERLKRSLTV